MLRVQGNVRPKTTLLQGTSVVRLQKEPHLLLFVCLLQPVDVWQCSTNGALSILARHNRQLGDNQYGAGSDLGRNAFKLRPITHLHGHSFTAVQRYSDRHSYVFRWNKLAWN